MAKRTPFQVVNVRRSDGTAAKLKKLAKLLTREKGERQSIADAAAVAADEALARRTGAQP